MENRAEEMTHFLVHEFVDWFTNSLIIQSIP